MDRLGILGGSFNPPHRGHIELARHALRELDLERVLLMPARASPGKPLQDDPGPQRRLEMCRLVAGGVDGVQACALELERDGPSYTVDTLRALHAAHPDIALTFILGADVASTLPTWHEAEALPALGCFAVAEREGAEPQDPLRPGAELGDLGFQILRLRTPMIDVSSSLVRERLRRGLPVDGLVGTAVATYIAKHGLYRAANAADAAPNAGNARDGTLRARMRGGA